MIYEQFLLVSVLRKFHIVKLIIVCIWLQLRLDNWVIICLEMSRAEIKWVTEPDDYECTLSEETQAIAKEELREDKNTRDQALASIREWIMQNPKILNCRLDARFLLRFLRFKKFSVLQAQEAIQRYILLRQTFGIAFNHLDIRIPMMQDLTDLGYLFAVPKRDKLGRRIIIARPG